jgi:hypothetical protein
MQLKGSMDRSHRPPSEAARAERYRLAQAAKIIRQLEEVVLVGDARDMKNKWKPQKPQK